MALANQPEEPCRVAGVAGMVEVERPIRLAAAAAEIHGDRSHPTRQKLAGRAENVPARRRTLETVQHPHDGSVRIDFRAPVDVDEVSIGGLESFATKHRSSRRTESPCEDRLHVATGGPAGRREGPDLRREVPDPRHCIQRGFNAAMRSCTGQAGWCEPGK
jgi:hypothetical protein